MNSLGKRRIAVSLAFLAAGVCLFLVVFILHSTGIRTPSLRIIKRVLALLSVACFFPFFLIKSGCMQRDVREEMRMQLKEWLHFYKTDIIIGLIIFFVSNLMGTWYVFIVQSRKIGLFYASTTGDYRPLFLSFTPFSPYGFYFGAVVMLSYALFRLGMNRIISCLCACAIILSSHHLHNLITSINRDYAKAPFLLAIIFIAGLLVWPPLKRSKLFLFSIIGGVVMGIGLRVRQDIMVFIPFFIAVIFLFLPCPLKSQMGRKCFAMLLFLTCFTFSALPKLYHSLSSAPARVVAGFMTPFEVRLELTRPAYDFGYLFSDEFVWAASYAQARASNPQRSYAYLGKEFNRIGSEFILKVIKNFPADVLIRMYASILKILEFPFAYTAPPIGISNPLVGAVYHWRAKALDVLAGHGVMMAFLALLIMSASGIRQAIFCLFALGYFGGYPFLQFQGRHYFYLEFIAWWIVGFLLQRAIRLFLKPRHIYTTLGKGWNIYARRVAIFALSAIVFILFSLAALRQYQSRHLLAMFSRYLTAEKQQLSFAKIPLNRRVTLITNQDRFSELSGRAVKVEYLVLDFRQAQSLYSTLWPIFRYERTPSLGRPGFSRTLGIDLENFEGEDRKIFFPAISYNEESLGSVYFKGIEMPNEQISCLQGLYQVKDPSQFPMLLTVTLPLERGNAELYQRLRGWETDNSYTMPNSMPSKEVKDLLAQPIRSLMANDIIFHDKIVTIKDTQWIINGYATPQSDPYNFFELDRTNSTVAQSLFADLSIAVIDTDLLRTKEIRLKKGSYFVAQGRLYTGGVTFGLIKEGLSAGYVTIGARGPFTVLIKTPSDGMYSLGIANNLDGYTSLENRAVIKKIGWIQAP